MPGQTDFGLRWFAAAIVALLLMAGCATLPGADYPKQASNALAQPATTRLGRQLDALSREHPETSGFRLLPQGRDSLRGRIELAETAERTLDLQYFIIQNDSSGKVLMNAVLHAADRGTRVRMLVDGYEGLTRDPQIAALAAQPNIEIRVFNPYRLGGPLKVFRNAEFLLFASRLNSRMHNKLFIADNAAAVIGGRNIGDEYFQASTELERADFDVLAIGPVVNELSRSFDAYWNSDMAIPIQALLLVKPSAEVLDRYRADLAQNEITARASTTLRTLDKPGPLAGVIADKGALTWARAEVLSDDPQKRKIEDGKEDGQLLRHRLEAALNTVTAEIRILSPYLVPGDDGMRLLESLRARGVRVRILTNSLAATDMPIAHVGYRHYRTRMLGDGVELYEVRPVLGDPTTSDGEKLKSSRTGQFAIHGKVFVLDQQRLFLGSMNFDYRSLRLNTEVGLLIDSPELARQVAQRFDAIAQPANCYIPQLGAPDASGKRQLTWRTEENGKNTELTAEPMGDILRGIQTELLSLLPIDDLL
jgi:putative cardiolipin synthase